MKKKILILTGVMALSVMAMAKSPASGTFSNRFGVNYGLSTGEKWDKEDATDYDVHDNSYGLNYKLLYNVTDRFRWGGELGYDNIEYSDKAKKEGFNDGSSVGVLLIGLTGEYDIYHGEKFAVYLNGSMGIAGSSADFDYKADKNGNLSSTTLDGSSYMKLGAGSRLSNGIGIELGVKMIGYKLEGDEVKDQVLTSGSGYFELNYTF